MPPFVPDSSQAKPISDLFITTLSIGGVIFLLVTVLVITAIVRYRERPGQPEPRPIFGNTRLELAWTITPAVILIVVAGLMINTMQRADPPVPANQQPDLVIIGHQWYWELHYPKLNVNSANEIHLPVGRKLLVELNSADVVHSFWVPNLSRKMDATPGMNVRMYMEADKPGSYPGTCVEYCGQQHAWMRILVIAQSPADFDAWVKQQSQVPPAPAGGEAARGAQVFQQDTCASCHTISGTLANKTFGPDLTHVASRQTLGAGVLDNTPANLKNWIQNPQAYKPGVLMPAFNLTNADANAIVAYLEANK